VDGQLPVNEHGSIEVWGLNPIFIPHGAAHLRMDKVEKVAKLLGIHYAPALVGEHSEKDGPSPPRGW
jgi:hypothetical protein